ncbi:MAG: transglutaminase TgpA family protein, partial [Phototrophicaceae bacterium]
PAIIMVANLIYSPQPYQLLPNMMIFSYLSLLLVTRSTVDYREWDWYQRRMYLSVPPLLRLQMNLGGAIIAMVALLLAWSVPTAQLNEPLANLRQRFRDDPLTYLAQTWNQLLSDPETEGQVTADYYGADSLTLSGAIQLGDQVVMHVEAPPGRRYYWRSRVFDTYQNGSWSSQANIRLLDRQPPFEVINEEMVFGSRVRIQQRFTFVSMASRLVYTAPLPDMVDLPTEADLRYDDDQHMNIYSIRPQKVLEMGSSYLVTSLMSNADATQLQTAGIQYPRWIIDTQLYIPPTVTGRTLELAQRIVQEANATTPYDRARAVEQWLRTNITYNENIPTPPFGQDPVDWVLFDHRQGYCNYYASSMVVMLRGLGIPSRMAAGFAAGEWDGQKYIVREKDAHTWVEVYFPNYGWVEFEPTASRGVPPTPTPMIDIANVPSPSPDMLVMQPPTSTATPTNTPTQPPTVTLNAPQDEALPLASVSPTPSPLGIPPTVPPPPTLTPQETPSDVPQANVWLEAFFQILLILLGLLLLLCIALGMILVGWWWLEWRDLEGYSAILQVYARTERYLTHLLGIPFYQNETPRERHKRIIALLPQRAERSLRAIVNLYQAERYGNQRHPRWEYQSLEAWKALREMLLWRWLRNRLPLLRRWWKE